MILSKQGNVTVIALDRRYSGLDQHLMNRAADQFRDVAEESDPPIVVLDFSRTEFFASAFLDLLLELNIELRHRGGALRLCCLRPVCEDMLRALKLDRLLTLCDTVPDAVEQLEAVTAH